METPFSLIVSNCNNKEKASIFLEIAAENLYDLSLLDHVAQLQSSIKDYNASINTLNKMLAGTNDKTATDAIKANLAVMHNKINEPFKALEYFNEIPADISNLMEKALSYYFIADYKSSEKIMRKIAEIPNLPDEIRNRVEYNLAIYEIENGNFKEGYFQYIDRGHRNNIWPIQQLAMVPIWRGEIESGKTILIHSEGGIGDEIIGIRFMNKIKQMGMRPIWKTNNKDLKEVFNRNGYETIIDYSEIDAENIAQCMAMFLPTLLNLDKDDVWFGTYLTADPVYIEKWKKILPEGNKLAVRWQGNTHYEQDLHRSIPKTYIENLNYNGSKISVQLEEKTDWTFNPEINSIEDTLAILTLCNDGLISSCTSVSHMAGALGIKTIVCPPIAYYYVWAKESKWYGDHVRVIRQENWKDWGSVFKRVQERINDK